MPFFEKSHTFTIENAEMNDSGRDTTTRRTYDSRVAGHNFSGLTGYRSQQDAYSGGFNGGNFGGNGRGGQAYQFASHMQQATAFSRDGKTMNPDFSDDEQSEDEAELLKEIERKKKLLKDKKAERVRKLKAQLAALDAKIAELDDEAVAKES
ncbi:hypothetical protein BDQ17DRAFT_1361706 [Cyathus striatus]|nr:hypothetical protein BDQ17DRAFT_1361706 [Cyathus striatus]